MHAQPKPCLLQALFGDGFSKNRSVSIAAPTQLSSFGTNFTNTNTNITLSKAEPGTTEQVLSRGLKQGPRSAFLNEGAPDERYRGPVHIPTGTFESPEMAHRTD